MLLLCFASLIKGVIVNIVVVVLFFLGLLEEVTSMTRHKVVISTSNTSTDPTHDNYGAADGADDDDDDNVHTVHDEADGGFEWRSGG